MTIRKTKSRKADRTVRRRVANPKPTRSRGAGSTPAPSAMVRLPRITTKTITVAGLLGKIKELILEEPLRLNMDMWISRWEGEILRAANSNLIAEPSCGTVGCMAGWGVVLLRPQEIPDGNLLNLVAPVFMRDLVGERNGIYSEADTHGLFAPAPALGERINRLPDPGTGAHAKVIAKRIDRYLKKYPEVARRKIDVVEARKKLKTMMDARAVG